MNRQKSFEQEKATLYIVATPIGNLNEMTPRAIEVLENVDVIAAEDTRNTIKLLTHFHIRTKMISHHQHNEKQSTRGIIDLLKQGKNIALVSDAGYPLISDPGSIVVREIIAAGFQVVPVSGSNAMLNALVASGLDTEHFMFYGFLKTSEKTRLNELFTLKYIPYTIVFYEAPHRIKKTIAAMLDVLGNRMACLARELTKKHEEFIRGSLEELLQLDDDLKGEIVIVVEGSRQMKDEFEDAAVPLVHEQIKNYIDSGLSTNEAIKRVAKERGLSRNEIYKQYHDIN